LKGLLLPSDLRDEGRRGGEEKIKIGQTSNIPSFLEEKKDERRTRGKEKKRTVFSHLFVLSKERGGEKRKETIS